MEMRARPTIVQLKDPVLRMHARPLARKEIDTPQVRLLIENMRRRLIKEKLGVGLAAPQVGVSARLFIVAGRVFEKEEIDEDKSAATNGFRKPEDTRREPHAADRVFINPEVLRVSRKKEGMSEGCLSVREIYGTVVRHEKITIRALDEGGKPFTYHAAGLLAQIFQHEIDHLNGILFIDKASTLQDTESGLHPTDKAR